MDGRLFGGRAFVRECEKRTTRETEGD